MDPLRHFSEVWCADFEFGASPGERPEVRCMVARESRSGRTIRVWADELATMSKPPFQIGAEALFVAYFASAELGCFLALGWPMPARVLDLFVEFRNLTNGLTVPCGNSLLGAMAYYGLDGIGVAEKDEMRKLALRGGWYSAADQLALLDYCQTDVDALVKLLPRMLPGIDLPRALLRGRYMAAVAAMEANGTPIDRTSLEALRENWGRLKGRLVREIDREYGVFVAAGKYRVDASTRYGAEVTAVASEIGCHPWYVAQSVDAVLAAKRPEAQALAAETAARRQTGLTVNRINAWEDAGRDYASWPGLDVTARGLAGEHPELGLGRGYVGGENFDDTDHAGLLWDRLRQPTEKPPTRLDPAVLAEAAAFADGAPIELPDDATWSFSVVRFAEWLVRAGIPWPRLASGALALDDDTLRQMAKTHPVVAPLRELRHTLGEMRLFSDLAVGADGRNRCLLSPFRATSSRNQPSNAKFIFGPSCWLRSLIQPEPGRAVAYVDWSQQEFGIAAALSHDGAMMAAYTSGDPYLTFAKQAVAVPADATKNSHPRERGQFKVCALAVQYGMGAESLARSLDQPPAYARELLQLHRQTYPVFWRWSEAAVNHAMLRGWLQTVFGWRVHVGPKANPRSLANSPMQANGAEMLRLACCLATERGIQVCAPVHDAVLVEGPTDNIETVVADTQAAMAEASRVVLGGFELRSDVKIVRYPDRYSDPRGERMWETVLRILGELEEPETEELEVAF
jgi:hypothetical protein